MNANIAMLFLKPWKISSKSVFSYGKPQTATRGFAAGRWIHWRHGP